MDTKIMKAVFAIAMLLCLQIVLPLLAVAEDSSAKNVPLVVFIHSRDCPVCAKVRPMLDSILPDYQAKVRFVRLDVTDAKSKEESKKLAGQLNIISFYELYEDTFPCVGFFNSKNKCVRELFGENPKDKYEKAFEKVTEAKNK